MGGFMTHCIHRTLALMLLSLFTACGGGEEPQAATPGSFEAER